MDFLIHRRFPISFEWSTYLSRGDVSRTTVLPFDPVAYNRCCLAARTSCGARRWNANLDTKERMMSIRLYVGNLPYSVTDEQLADLFAPQ